MEFHSAEVKDVFKELGTGIEGLTNSEAEKRTEKYGKNILKKFKEVSVIALLLSQVQNFVVYILIAAALVSAFLGEVFDAVIIGVIVVLNMVLGFIQEYKAEKAIEALRKLTTPKTIVLRDGKITEIDSADVIPGDVIMIEEGSYIPADARLFEAIELRIDESTLTGESLPVQKHTEVVPRESMIADMRNSVFAGTLAVSGRGKAVVTSTGLNTQLGNIAKGIHEAGENPTPLEIQLEHLGKFITAGTIFIAFVIFLLGAFRGAEPIDSFITAVALAVAAIPEGLPAVVTITLALGTQRLLKKNSLMRKLPAIETLGSTNTICTDKTGTLTMNQMTVRKIFANGRAIEVTGRGMDLEGEFREEGKKVEDLSPVRRLMQCAQLCNNATIYGPSDPTEKALLVAVKKTGFEFREARVREIPFSSAKKYMVTFNRVDSGQAAFMKGAPEMVLEHCDRIEMDGKIKKLSKEASGEIASVYRRMAEDALRVMGFAYDPDGEGEKFVFLGLIGMIDPPRKGVKESIEQCRNAGIRVIMITGDYEITAKAIGKEIGITGGALTGRDLDKMALGDLKKVVEDVNIYARVSPEHKVNILQALREKGHVVAMTGDGVNDAPALKMADIGIAVGSGTDVAKEASDMVLLDDNFVSIVEAVKEGRGIYSNIRKFVQFLLSCNLGEVLVIFLAMLFGIPLPLIAIQILWVNLLTDGLPALALGMDPVDPEVMVRPPRKKNERIVGWDELKNLLLQGAIITVGVLLLFEMYLPKGIDYARTVAFSSLVAFQLFNSLNYRLDGHSILSRHTFENKFLLGAILISFALQLAVVYGLGEWFRTVPLGLYDWAAILGVSLSIVIIYEVKKILFRQL